MRLLVGAVPVVLLVALSTACSSEDEKSSPEADASDGSHSSGGSSSGSSSTGGSPGGSSSGGSASSGGTSTGGAGAADASSSASGGTTNGGADAASGGSSGTGGETADSGTSLPGWTLVWGDEFDGPAGTLPDASKWVMETGGNGWGNNELEYYTDRAENAALDGSGALVITARSEVYMGRDYTSARLKTQGTFDHTYGRFEAAIRIPSGQGIWPAFWMLGNDIGTVGWPSCGEIDVMENVGREPTTVHGTIHGPGYSGGNGIGASYSLPDNAPFAAASHVYAVEWEAAAIRWYVDDALYQTLTPSDLPQGTTWVYTHPFFILLNVAVGGQWPGSPDGTTTFPQQMIVDYVRVYAPAP